MKIESEPFSSKYSEIVHLIILILPTVVVLNLYLERVLI